MGCLFLLLDIVEASFALWDLVQLGWWRCLVAAVLLKYYMMALWLIVGEWMLRYRLCTHRCLIAPLRIWLYGHRVAIDILLSGFIFWSLGPLVLFDRVRDSLCHGCSLHQLLVFRDADQYVQTVARLHRPTDADESVVTSFASTGSHQMVTSFTSTSSNPGTLMRRRLVGCVHQEGQPFLPPVASAASTFHGLLASDSREVESWRPCMWHGDVGGPSHSGSIMGPSAQSSTRSGSMSPANAGISSSHVGSQAQSSSEAFHSTVDISTSTGSGSCGSSTIEPSASSRPPL